jgi:hypothetical protein
MNDRNIVKPYPLLGQLEKPACGDALISKFNDFTNSRLAMSFEQAALFYEYSPEIVINLVCIK